MMAPPQPVTHRVRSDLDVVVVVMVVVMVVVVVVVVVVVMVAKIMAILQSQQWPHRNKPVHCD